MNVGFNLWDQLTRVVIFLLFIAGLLAVAVWYMPLIKTNERLRRDILSLQLEIQREEQTAKQLKASRDAILHDPKTVERLGREILNYGKPGETIIRFEPAPTNAPPTAPR
jgi:hypothetical protein